MYQVNGVDLTSGQYDELRALVRVHDAGGDVKAEASRRLGLSPTRLFPEEVANENFMALAEKRLVARLETPSVELTGSQFFFGGLTAAGIDFVHDYEATRKAERKDARARSRHDFLVEFSGGYSASSASCSAMCLASSRLTALPVRTRAQRQPRASPSRPR